VNLRAPRRLTLLALAAPALAVLPTAGPASAVRPDSVSPIYAVSQWTDGGSKLPADGLYSKVEVTYNATYGIAPDGQVVSAVDWWADQSLVAPAFDRPIVDLSANSSFGLAIDDQGHLHSWGAAPTLSDDDYALVYRDVAVTSGGAIAVTTDGDVRYLGSVPTEDHFAPATLAGTDVVSVDAESSAVVALTADGHVISAGYALDGTYGSAADPFPADRAEETFTAVDAGDDFAVALTDDGQVVAWGWNAHGETHVPTFPAGRHAVAVSGGMWRAAAVLDDGSIVFWGDGEVYDGDTSRLATFPDAPAGVKTVDIDLDRYRAAVTYAALTPTSTPTLSDDPVFGTPLSVDVDWSDEPDSLGYVWRIDGVERSTDPTYTPVASDVGHQLSVTVTAEKAGYVAGTSSVGQTTVTGLSFTTAPTVTITGSAKVGHTLTAAVDATDPAADSYDVSWLVLPNGPFPLLASSAGSAGTLPGDSLDITPQMLGARVLVMVVAHKAGYEDAMTTDDLPEAIGDGTLAAPRATVVGTPRVGKRLTARVADDAAATGTAYQWLRDGKVISGARAAAYTPVAADLGRALSLRVTSSADGYTTASGTSAATRVSPGAARLAVRVPRKAVVGRKVAVAVTGLAAGERFTVTVGGKRVAGTASHTGMGTVSLKLTGKPGKRAVTVVGSYADRVGSATLRVVKH
jgi:hypothetical protein